MRKLFAKYKKISALILVLVLSLLLFACGNASNGSQSPQNNTAAAETHTETESGNKTDDSGAVSQIDEDGIYDSKENVSLYIHEFGHLPSNYITKKEAGELGWKGGDLRPYADNKCIGGDSFGNIEGLLPKKKGRSYYECDIDTLGKKSRGAKRIIFSDDGLIFYTDDHYSSFEQLY